MGQFPNPDTQFKSGNPGGPGRPRKDPITAEIREQLLAADADGVTAAAAIVAAMIRKARRGSVAAFVKLTERAEGRTPLRIEADINVEHHDPDLPGILAALGYERRRDQAAAGEGEPGRAGGGGEPRPVEDGAAPGAA